MSEQGPCHARGGPQQICPDFFAISPRHKLDTQPRARQRSPLQEIARLGVWHAMLRAQSGQ